MKKKHLFLAATAIFIASCSDTSYLGDQAAIGEGVGGPISFNMSTPALTRADQDHATSAATLNSQFVVWGEKSNAAETSAAGTPVFINYVVNYGASTAGKTESNSHDWEYVGQTRYADDKVGTTGWSSTAPTITEQTIKYWDFTNKYYTFTAFSAKSTDITGGNVIVTKNVTGTSTVYEKGYTVAVRSSASIGDIYFSDRTLVEATSPMTSAVTLKFRNLQSRVRFGFYETVPGYSVKITNVKFNNATSHESDGPGNFGVDCKGSTTGTGAVVVAGTNTSFTVTYDDGSEISANMNKAKVTVGGGASTLDYLSTKANNFFDQTLGVTSDNALFENTGNYTTILPNPSNTIDLTLTISYTLTSTDGSGETIDITDATAKVPAVYAQWQANYAYTYLFKISDNFDGLYPITFDAVVVEDEAGKQETITTVSEPSITTYAKGVNPTAAATAEYPTGSNIYVTVDNNGTVETLSASNAKLYLVNNITGTGTEQSITEESVANALVNGSKDDTTNPTTWTVTGVGMKNLIVTTTGVPTLSFVSSIPAADSPTGVAINIDGTNTQGAKFTPVASTYTAVTPVGTENPSTEGWYEEGASTGNYILSTDTSVDGTKTYYTRTPGAGYYAFEYTANYVKATGTYDSSVTYYTDATGGTQVDPTGFDSTTDVSSYYISAGATPAKYYKVIKVVE